MPPPNLHMLIIPRAEGECKVEKKRMGRPTDTPKNNRESFRLSDEDMTKLRFCMEKTDMSKTDIVRKGIELVYQEIIKK